MGPRDAVQAPDLPRLEIAQLPLAQEVEDLELYGALIEREAGEPLRPRRVRIRESELRGVVLDARDAPGLELIDVVLGHCGLSNVDGREGLIRRVEVARSRLVARGCPRTRLASGGAHAVAGHRRLRRSPGSGPGHRRRDRDVIAPRDLITLNMALLQDR
jgi:hypothetical protein